MKKDPEAFAALGLSFTPSTYQRQYFNLKGEFCILVNH